MRKILGRIMVMLLIISALTVASYARRSPICQLPDRAVLGRVESTRPVNVRDLTPFLQAERNEIALLTAQSNCLQQQGDPLGAALVASYIPDHQMQANALATAIQARGGDPATIVANVTPALGARTDVVEHDITAHQQVARDYQRLAQRTSDTAVRQLALMGQGGAERHLNSLIIARASTGAASRINEGLIASLALERGAINDLQTQAAQLTALGQTDQANKLTTLIPRKLPKAKNLISAQP